MTDTPIAPVARVIFSPVDAEALAPLARFKRLRYLNLNGHDKDIEVLTELTRLERLILRSVTLPGLDLLVSLPRLCWLELKLGGTRDLSRLPDLGALLHLELWRIRGVTDLSVLGSLPALESLFLQSMGRVTELSSFVGTRALRWVALESMKGLTDLKPLAAAPRLEHLFLVAMGQLEPEDLACFIGHPNLRAAVWGLGSVRKNRAAQELLPLEQPLSLPEFWSDRR